MADAAYFRAWRAAHPGYRARERERSRRRDRGDRSAEYARAAAARPSRALAPIPPLHRGHPLLDQAVAIAARYARTDRRDWLLDPLYDDVVGAVVLALLAGDDPDAAARTTRATEVAYRRLCGPLFEQEKAR